MFLFVKYADNHALIRCVGLESVPCPDARKQLQECTENHGKTECAIYYLLTLSLLIILIFSNGTFTRDGTDGADTDQRGKADGLCPRPQLLFLA